MPKHVIKEWSKRNDLCRKMYRKRDNESVFETSMHFNFNYRIHHQKTSSPSWVLKLSHFHEQRKDTLSVETSRIEIWPDSWKFCFVLFQRLMFAKFKKFDHLQLFFFFCFIFLDKFTIKASIRENLCLQIFLISSIHKV